MLFYTHYQQLLSFAEMTLKYANFSIKNVLKTHLISIPNILIFLLVYLLYLHLCTMGVKII